MEVTRRCEVLKLYADEGYHALFSKDLAEQIAGYHRLERYRSVRLKHLSRLLVRYSGKWEELALFVMAFISETVITRELSLLGQDDLNVPVFSMLTDHLHDEAKHSVFFCRLLCQAVGAGVDRRKGLYCKCIVSGGANFLPSRYFIYKVSGKRYSALS
ncbi:diiron oxygenase [Pseudomonas alloputida]|uniref:diiron oxygenase n=1 Tax=Pseudomonas TaxID=286 RepID=UPI003EE8A8AC